MERLLYISTAREALDEATLEAILRSSRRNNAMIGVTGLLVAGGRRFLQMLEGQEAAVTRTFDRICADPRHFAIVTLSRKSVERRLTSGWSMAFQAAAESGEGDTLPEIVARLVADINDAVIRAEFTQFAVHHAAA